MRGYSGAEQQNKRRAAKETGIHPEPLAAVDCFHLAEIRTRRVFADDFPGFGRWSPGKESAARCNKKTV